MEVDRWIEICIYIYIDMYGTLVTWVSATGNLLTLAFPTCYFPTQHGLAARSSTNRRFSHIFDAQAALKPPGSVVTQACGQ